MTEKKGVLKVFISSTYRDLKEVRKLLIQGIEEALEAVAMERFPPGDEPFHEKIIEYLNGSDVCVFIIEEYYGTIIEGCEIRTGKCGDCNGNISYTHCEYRNALLAGKPYIVYIVKNDMLDILSKIPKFDLKSTREIEILGFLKRNNIDISKIPLFSGYTVEQIKELWNITKDENRERLEQFRKEIRGLCREMDIFKREDYYLFYETIVEDLKNSIVEWYKKKKIKFADFVGRRKELQELLTKIHENKPVCVVGTAGIGKTSLVQLELLLEKLSGRKIYALFKRYSYDYTNAGYSLARGKFNDCIFAKQLTLMDILNLVFQEHVKLNEILEMDKNDQISVLIDELNRERSVLFIDDFQDADRNVEELVHACSNNLDAGAVVVGSRREEDFFSTVGPLTGLRGTDLREMIKVFAKTHSVRKYIKGNLNSWSKEIFRITQGHPMLVDVIVRNASVFPDLKGIAGVMDVKNQKTVNEIMNRLIYQILTDEELRFIRFLSSLPGPVTKRQLDMIDNGKISESIIRKGFLQWKEEGLIFTFDVIKELVETRAASESPNP